MSTSKPGTAPHLVTELNPKGIKPCCACPETKAARDDCFLRFGHSVEEHGESARKCEELVKRHRACMASLGFNI
ncbi:cytochrome c oxidase subunit 17 [Malassezia restricta]|uniref:cytochrome c oxidase subunit 17 n=1 Tax=Malassezia restricta TaxID=76775 RepID=UPI000DD18653|nr:cytochrome c oxidase subunit 17 [Malassezia restricta]AXA50625.1 cytochrome c oxidase subunit 17 [Malassezia restricta]